MVTLNPVKFVSWAFSPAVQKRFGSDLPEKLVARTAIVGIAGYAVSQILGHADILTEKGMEIGTYAFGALTLIGVSIPVALYALAYGKKAADTLSSCFRRS